MDNFVKRRSYILTVEEEIREKPKLGPLSIDIRL